uniref:Uncharacterized protein n=1 Tax=Romanomermis culicivorax TaxID=13658 RepID=A0A915IIR1_ROMCU
MYAIVYLQFSFVKSTQTYLGGNVTHVNENYSSWFFIFFSRVKQGPTLTISPITGYLEGTLVATCCRAATPIHRDLAPKETQDLGKGNLFETVSMISLQLHPYLKNLTLGTSETNGNTNLRSRSLTIVIRRSLDAALTCNRY